MNEELPQLRMLWPAGRAVEAGWTSCPPGYSLREARGDDTEAWVALLERVDLGTWDEQNIASTMRDLVPRSWVVVEHETTGDIVATCMALRRPLEGSTSEDVEVGWVAADPGHSGRRLARVAVAASLAAAVDNGSGSIYLQTDDFRLPALKTYLGTGFVPLLWNRGMSDRWRRICDQLDWAYTPELWPEAP